MENQALAVKTVPIRVRIEEELAERIDALAERLPEFDRSKTVRALLRFAIERAEEDPSSILSPGPRAE